MSVHLRGAIARHEATGRPPSRAYLRSLHTLGELQRDRAEYGEARELLEQSNEVLSAEYRPWPLGFVLGRRCQDRLDRLNEASEGQR